MKIRTRLITLGVAAVFGTWLATTVTDKMSYQAIELEERIIQTKDMEISLLSLRRTEKDFRLRGDDSYVDKFKKQMVDLTETITRFKPETLAIAGYDHQDFLEAKANYQKTFMKLAVLETKVRNLEGKLKGANDLERVTINEELDKVKAILGVTPYAGLTHELSLSARAIESKFNILDEKLSAAVEVEKQQIEFTRNALVAAIFAVIILLIVRSVLVINRQVLEVKNELKRRVAERDIGGGDLPALDQEFMEIFESLALLFGSLGGVISDSQHGAEQVKQFSDDIVGETKKLVGSSERTSDVAERMTDATSGLSEMISDVGRTTQHAAESAELAKTDAISGRENVNSTINNIETLATSLKTSEAEILALNKLVENIAGSVSMIQGIAEQTNLLALNAAIEAARAGEQGRGFAVVADEVRTLASRTQESTEEITGLVNGIQSQMADVVESMQGNTKVSEQTVVDSHNLQKMLADIIDGLETIHENSLDVATAVNQQGVAVNDIVHGLEDVNKASSENLSVASACSELSENISELSTKASGTMSTIRT